MTGPGMWSWPFTSWRPMWSAMAAGRGDCGLASGGALYCQVDDGDLIASADPAASLDPSPELPGHGLWVATACRSYKPAAQGQGCPSHQTAKAEVPLEAQIRRVQEPQTVWTRAETPRACSSLRMSPGSLV